MTSNLTPTPTPTLTPTTTRAPTLFLSLSISLSLPPLSLSFSLSLSLYVNNDWSFDDQQWVQVLAAFHLPSIIKNCCFSKYKNT